MSRGSKNLCTKIRGVAGSGGFFDGEEVAAGASIIKFQAAVLCAARLRSDLGYYRVRKNIHVESLKAVSSEERRRR